MELKYKLTEEEFIHKSLRLSEKIPASRQRQFAVPLFFGVLWAVMAWTLWSILPWTALGAAIGLLFGWWLTRSSTRSQLASVYKIYSVRENITLEVNEGGVYIALPHMRSQIDWEAITAIEEDARGFYLNYDPHQALFVPRRVFSSAAQAQQFWSLAQEYWQFARPVPQRVRVP